MIISSIGGKCYEAKVSGKTNLWSKSKRKKKKQKNALREQNEKRNAK